MHEPRAACLLSLLKPSLQVWWGLSTWRLPGSLGFFPCLQNVRQSETPPLHTEAAEERLSRAWAIMIFSKRRVLECSFSVLLCLESLVQQLYEHQSTPCACKNTVRSTSGYGYQSGHRLSPAPGCPRGDAYNVRRPETSGGSGSE